MRWTKYSVFLLCAAGVFHLHRAWALAITTDEAFTAIGFASLPWIDLFTSYDANHHILHTILCKISLGAFGWNVLALRLPALLGGIVCLFLIHRLARLLFGDSPLQLALCGWLAFHPALLDWFSIARGYGLAMAFMIAAVGELSGPLPRLTRASVWLGLSVAANLVFSVPASAIALAWPAARREWKRLPDLAVPGAAIALVITVIPLSRASGSNFYYGADTLWKSLESLLAIPRFEPITPFLILLVPASAAAALWLGRREENLRFFAWSLVLSILATAVLRFAGMPYPLGRTGIHLVVLWILCLAQMASLARPAWISFAAVAAVSAFLFAAPIGYYSEWRYSAGSRNVLERIAAEPGPDLTVAADPILFYGLEFYRRMPEFSRISRIGRLDEASRSRFIILISDGRSPPPLPGAEVVWLDSTSGIALYRR